MLSKPSRSAVFAYASRSAYTFRKSAWPERRSWGGVPPSPASGISTPQKKNTPSFKRVKVEHGRRLSASRRASMARALPLPHGSGGKSDPMREPVEPVKPGHEVASSLTWQGDESMQPGARVEGTDGLLGVLRERRTDAGPEHAYLGVETPEGMLYVPERLVRETRGNAVVLSLPTDDVRANSSLGTLPVRERVDELPRESR